MTGKGPALAMGAYLTTNDYLTSPDGRYFAILQSDGNFVIYHGNGPTNQGTFVWNSGVAPGGDQHFFAIMQNDSNWSSTMAAILFIRGLLSGIVGWVLRPISTLPPCRTMATW